MEVSRAVTQWVENPVGGRDRGPRAVVRAWTEVLARPRRFFETGTAPGDQAPGLTFAMAVVLVATATGLVPPAVGAGGEAAARAALVVAAAVLFVTPAGLHLVAAVQTLLLVAFAPDRAGVGRTVQVLAYATAPCVVAGVPVPAVRVACGVYGAALLVVGTAAVHEVSLPRAAGLAAVPVVLVFGYGFRTFAAAAALVDQVATAVGALA